MSTATSFRPVYVGHFTYTVAEKRGAPAGKHAAKALGGADRAVRLHVALVELRVHLASAFDQIEGCHRRMGQTLSRQNVRIPRVDLSRKGSTNTGHHPTNCTGGIVLGRPGFDFARFFLGLLADDIVLVCGLFGKRIGFLLGFVDCAPGGEWLAPRLSWLCGARVLFLFLRTQTTQWVLSGEDGSGRVRWKHDGWYSSGSKVDDQRSWSTSNESTFSTESKMKRR